MHKIIFDAGKEEHKAAFALLYQGFLLGTPQGGLRGITAHRDALQILDKFEAISDPMMQTVKTEDGPKQVMVRLEPTGDVMRELADQGGKMELGPTELNMLKEHFNNVPFRVGLSRAVVRAGEMLEINDD